MRSLIDYSISLTHHLFIPQISLLLGDFMSQLRVRYAEEVIIKAEKDAIIALPVKKDANALPVEGEGNKFAGFF